MIQERILGEGGGGRRGEEEEQQRQARDRRDRQEIRQEQRQGYMKMEQNTGQIIPSCIILAVS
jgi:hypothetical protein